MARFFIIAGIAWYLKPLIGTLSDYFPIFGTRRYSYILGGSAALALLWTALGLGPRTPGLMLGATLLLTTVLAICHATVSALVVEGGRMFAATGRLSTVRRVAEHAAAVAAGPAGGLLAMYSFVVTGVACAALALLKEQEAACARTRSEARAIRRERYSRIILTQMKNEPVTKEQRL